MTHMFVLTAEMTLFVEKTHRLIGVRVYLHRRMYFHGNQPITCALCAHSCTPYELVLACHTDNLHAGVSSIQTTPITVAGLRCTKFTLSQGCGTYSLCFPWARTAVGASSNGSVSTADGALCAAAPCRPQRGNADWRDVRCLLHALAVVCIVGCVHYWVYALWDVCAIGDVGCCCLYGSLASGFPFLSMSCDAWLRANIRLFACQPFALCMLNCCE